MGGETVFNDDSTAEGQTISREDALMAHTRRNAFFIFQENNLGSNQLGKLADLVVLDRDYSPLPTDQS
jgi:predicted amidohydrolase YtcJ